MTLSFQATIQYRQDIEFFIAVNFLYVVLDESQHIKNPSSNIYRAVMRLRADHRIVLTGTPVENSLTDLWTQLSFVNPGFWAHSPSSDASLPGP